MNGPLNIASPRPFRFALCADDYAMTPGVSAGIVEALDAGSLSATSVMTTSSEWPEAAPALRPYAGRTDIGLHLNLTLGAPLGPMPAFAPGNVLPGIGRVLRLSRGNALPMSEIAAEIDRQLDRFAFVWGAPPDHVDGHQHVQVLRPIRRLLLDALARRGWTPWLRDSGDGIARILRRRSSLKKAAGLAFLANDFGAEATRAGFRFNEGFAGFSDFDPGEDYAALFVRYLSAPGPRHLVMCHPGHVDDALRRIDPVVETREQELRFLTSRRFGEVLAAEGATLARLGDMF